MLTTIEDIKLIGELLPVVLPMLIGYNQASNEYNAATQTFVAHLVARSIVCPGASITGNSTITGPHTSVDSAFISY